MAGGIRVGFVDALEDGVPLGCHPIGAALYLKRGMESPSATVSARTPEITKLKGYRDDGYMRTSYDDIVG